MTKQATGVVAYISVAGWLIAYFVGDKEEAKFHLNQALVLNIISMVADIALGYAGILALLIPVINIVILVASVKGAVDAYHDVETPLPVIGKLQILK